MASTTWRRIVLPSLALVVVLTTLPVAVPAGEQEPGTKQDRAAARRAEIDAAARETLDQLLAESPEAEKLYDKAAGYAVFSNLKIAVGVSGGGGSGVAVSKSGGKRTYMKMGTAGIGLGLGGQRYRVVFLFENDKVLGNFVDKGWQADVSAQAAAGTAGAGVASSFRDGLAVFQFSDKGLMASADLSGTKYWKADKLN